MNNKIIVKVTYGKNENVNHINIMLFDDVADAILYIDNVTESGKYWTKAEIINAGVIYNI